LTVTNYWDQLERLTGTKFPDGSTTSNIYSALDITATKDRLGYWTYFGYNSVRQKIAETNANNEVIRYTNNAAGDLLSLTDGKNQTTKWNYDAYGRVTNKLDQAGAEILRYTYDADSRLSNRWSVAQGYDDLRLRRCRKSNDHQLSTIN
jgi:YD repeat-containing protein